MRVFAVPRSIARSREKRVWSQSSIDLRGSSARTVTVRGAGGKKFEAASLPSVPQRSGPPGKVPRLTQCNRRACTAALLARWKSLHGEDSFQQFGVRRELSDSHEAAGERPPPRVLLEHPAEERQRLVDAAEVHERHGVPVRHLEVVRGEL